MVVVVLVARAMAWSLGVSGVLVQPSLLAVPPAAAADTAVLVVMAAAHAAVHSGLHLLLLLLPTLHLLLYRLATI